MGQNGAEMKKHQCLGFSVGKYNIIAVFWLYVLIIGSSLRFGREEVGRVNLQNQSMVTIVAKNVQKLHENQIF